MCDSEVLCCLNIDSCFGKLGVMCSRAKFYGLYPEIFIWSHIFTVRLSIDIRNTSLANL